MSPKYWSFSFSIIPSKEIPGLIFRMDWLDLLAVQGTLKSLLQHHNSKASRYHIHRRYLGELYCPLHHVKIQKAELGQESQASSCLRKGTPLASRVAQGVSGTSSSGVFLRPPKVPRHAGFPRGEHRGSRHWIDGTFLGPMGPDTLVEEYSRGTP